MELEVLVPGRFSGIVTAPPADQIFIPFRGWPTNFLFWGRNSVEKTMEADCCDLHRLAGGSLVPQHLLLRLPVTPPTPTPNTDGVVLKQPVCCRSAFV